MRRSSMRQIVHRIEVAGHEIRITGPNSSLASGALNSGSAPLAGVLRFGQGWWDEQDSNGGARDRKL